MMDPVFAILVILATAGTVGLVAGTVIGLFQRNAGQCLSTRACSTTDEITVRVMSHNIRYAATKLARGEEPWPNRQPMLASQFIYHSKLAPDCFICLQEVLHHQLTDLLASLNGPSFSGPLTKVRQRSKQRKAALNTGEWAAVGVGRDDGKEAGEFAPILYRPAVWRLKEWETVWLSPEPMRRGWDAASIRILTVASFQHQVSGKVIVVLNTHLDDQGPIARRKGAEIVVEVVKRWTRRDGQDVALVTGDLNSEVDGDAYQVLSHSLTEVGEQCQGTARYGDYFTFTGFSKEEEKQRLDYIFVGPKSAEGVALCQLQWAAKVQGYAVLPNKLEAAGGRPVYMSDHRAIVADVAIHL